MSAKYLPFVTGPLLLALQIAWFVFFVLVVIPLAWLALKILANW
jgi:hypothetical protein